MELARLRDSSAKGHHVYCTVYLVGEVSVRDREVSDSHCEWAKVNLKQPVMKEVINHVSDDSCVLFPFAYLWTGTVYEM